MYFSSFKDLDNFVYLTLFFVGYWNKLKYTIIGLSQLRLCVERKFAKVQSHLFNRDKN